MSSSPMTADEFVGALHAEGVTVVEHPGWRTHNRAGHGAWGPVHGVLIHHTAGVAPSDGDIVYNGRSDLPGPDAQCYLAKDGVVTMTGNGRANHAGGGDPAVLAAVISENYDTRPPATHEHEGSPGAVDGNISLYGLEISNRGDGKDPYPSVQYEAAVRWAAAVCRHHGWTAKSVIGHKEWSDWKSDPSFDIVQFRADVAKQLGTVVKPDQPTPTPAPPAPAKPKVSLARVVAAARRDPGAAQGHTTYAAEVRLVEQALAAEGLLSRQWIDGSFGSRTVTAYAAWQRRCGYSGTAADGIPGMATLRRLGNKHGFTVTS